MIQDEYGEMVMTRFFITASASFRKAAAETSRSR